MAKKSKGKPVVYWLRWSRSEGAWVLYRSKMWIAAYLLPSKAMPKRDAVRLAASEVRARWRVTGNPTQLRVCAKNGRIVDERSYGSDRRDREG